MNEKRIKFVVLPNGIKLRYLEAGRGAPLLLIHPLRTQLEYFEKIIPLLKDHFLIIALDLPGHGYSEIPQHEDFDEPFFRKSAIEFIEKLDLRNLTIAGESIGATIALTIAANLEERIKKVYAFNPYDYGETFGGGIRRSKFGFIIGLFAIFRQFTVEPTIALKLVLSGGLKEPKQLPEKLVKEFVKSGNRPGYRKAEYLLHKNWRSWIAARRFYKKITVPTTVAYSDQDWSRPEERTNNKLLLSGANFVEIKNSGHFLSLEAPIEVVKVITSRV